MIDHQFLTHGLCLAGCLVLPLRINSPIQPLMIEKIHCFQLRDQQTFLRGFFDALDCIFSWAPGMYQSGVGTGWNSRWLGNYLSLMKSDILMRWWWRKLLSVKLYERSGRVGDHSKERHQTFSDLSSSILRVLFASFLFIAPTSLLLILPCYFFLLVTFPLRCFLLLPPFFSKFDESITDRWTDTPNDGQGLF